MWDNSGAEQDLYRNNRDSVLLPSMESLFGRIGEELIPDNVRQRNKVCNRSTHHCILHACTSEQWRAETYTLFSLYILARLAVHAKTP